MSNPQGGPGDPYIAFGKALNNSDTTVNELVKAALDCGLIVTFGVQPDPQQSIDIGVSPPIVT